MTSSKLRRVCGTVAVAAAVSLLTAAPALAARHESDPAPVPKVMARGLLQDVWTFFNRVWEAGNWMVDPNGHD